MANSGKFGWFLGLVFGTLFGVLFAPRKGKDLRDRIKAERKKGNLGFAPLQSDMKDLGGAVADLARDIYSSEMVQSVVQPLRQEIGANVDFVKSEISHSKKKAKASAKIAKRALKDMKAEMKKKHE